MDPDADLALVAALMADRHRAQMLLTLLGGMPQSGSALAEAAGISRSLASAHLKKLVAGGLVRAQPSGRQQLYSIASEPVADALEILILLAPPTRVGSLGDATRVKSLRWARKCYDHLAGMVGVSVTEALLRRGLLRERDGGYLVATDGAAEFGDFGIDVDRLERADLADAPALPGLERAPLSPRGQSRRGPDQGLARAPLDHHQTSQPHRHRDQGPCCLQVEGGSLPVATELLFASLIALISALGVGLLRLRLGGHRGHGIAAVRPDRSVRPRCPVPAATRTRPAGLRQPARPAVPARIPRRPGGG